MLNSTNEPPSIQRTARQRRRRAQWSVRLTPLGVGVVLVCNLTILAVIAWPFIQARLEKNQPILPAFSNLWGGSSTQSPTPTQISTFTPTPQLSTPSPLPPSHTPTYEPTQAARIQQGLILLALDEGNHSHLFAYQPLQGQAAASLPLSRLTFGAWDDLDPAVSPDGKKVVFTSNRTGYWDLYILDLPSGATSRLTDSLEYDGAPSWSPDGLWVVFESYFENSLDIFILSALEPQQPPIRLTYTLSADHSPAWSPQGRRIAFVSDRSGEAEIWQADLDQADETLFLNLSHNPNGLDQHLISS